MIPYLHQRKLFGETASVKSERLQWQIWNHCRWISSLDIRSILITVQRDATQSSLFIILQFPLYMFRVSTTPIMSTQNCNYSLCSYLHPTWPSLATLEGGRCTKNMTSTRGCSYSFVCSWWWVWLTPETCRIINRLLCVLSRWAIINIDQRCMEP